MPLTFAFSSLTLTYFSAPVKLIRLQPGKKSAKSFSLPDGKLIALSLCSSEFHFEVHHEVVSLQTPFHNFADSGSGRCRSRHAAARIRKRIRSSE